MHTCENTRGAHISLIYIKHTSKSVSEVLRIFSRDHVSGDSPSSVVIELLKLPFRIWLIVVT